VKHTPVNMRNCQIQLSMHVKILQNKLICWKCVARKIGFVYSRLFIASKWLNNLTTIDTLSWLGGAEVMYPLWVWKVPGSIPGSCKGFDVWFFVLLFLCFYFLSKTTWFVTKVCNSLCNVNLFSILNILQDLWQITRV